MRLTLFCPSRGRPAEARALKHSFDQTRTTLDAELVFLIDDDDPTRQDYPRYGYGGYGDGVVVGPGTGDPTGPLNRAALGSKSDIVGFCGDDSRFETAGWDAKVLAALEAPGLCWGDDGHDFPWPSTAFVSRIIVSALGWLSLPTLRRGFFDVVWMNLAGGSYVPGAGWRFAPGSCARVLPDVMFRHDNSKGHVAPEVIAQDERAYGEWLRDRARVDIQTVRHAIYA